MHRLFPALTTWAVFLDDDVAPVEWRHAMPTSRKFQTIQDDIAVELAAASRR